MSTAPTQIYAFAGSRSLSIAGEDTAYIALAAMVRAHPALALVCGCCRGADSVALRAAGPLGLAPRLSVLCAFGPPVARRGATAWPGVLTTSSPHSVSVAVAAGAHAAYWSGGGHAVPVAVRLACRTRAVAAAATAGGLVIVEGRYGPGSALMVRSLTDRGLPVWVVPVADGPGGLPPIAGAWRWDYPAMLGGLGTWCLPGAAPSALTLAA